MQTDLKWSTQRLGDVATLQRGMDLPVQVRRPGSVPIYGSNGVVGFHSSAPVEGPGVITGRSGSIGLVFFSPRAFWPLNTTLYVRDFHGNDPKFLARLLTHLRLDRFVAATGVPSLNRNFVHPLPVSVPPLPEQRQIAEILDTVDEAIRKTEEIIAKLEQVKQGLLHDLLTRGIDDNGELRDPDRNPEYFKDSPLGRIPREWQVLDLGAVVPKAVYGINDSLDAGPGVPVLRMMNLRDGEADLADLKFSRSAAARDLLLRPGDVLFNRTNSIDHVGRTGIWRGQLPEASFASYLVRLDADLARLRPEFLNRWLNWEVTQIRIRRYATPGVHQVNINPTNLRRTAIGLPASLEEQDAAVAALSELDSRLRSEASERGKLRLLKTGLMEDLLTGRVRVTKLLEGAAE